MNVLSKEGECDARDEPNVSLLLAKCIAKSKERQVGAAKSKFFTSPYSGGVATYMTRETHGTEHNTVEQS
jgi:hypothetical protein